MILAHELGHILSDHVLYTTALNILLRATFGLPLLGLPVRAVRAVLLEWQRAAELSCDRAAVLAVRDPQIVCRALMVVAAGLPADQLDLDAFMAQAMEYENWEDSHDRIRRFFNEINATHSYSVRRVSEVMKWVQSGEYDRIIRGEYRKRGDDTNVRAEASDAMEYYAERFRALFQELGENVTNLGSQVGDVSQQVADWLRKRGSGGDGGSGGSGSGGSGSGGSGSGGSGPAARRAARARTTAGSELDGRLRARGARQRRAFEGGRSGAGTTPRRPAIRDKAARAARVWHGNHVGHALRDKSAWATLIFHVLQVASRPTARLPQSCRYTPVPLPVAGLRRSPLRWPRGRTS